MLAGAAATGSSSSKGWAVICPPQHTHLLPRAPAAAAAPPPPRRRPRHGVGAAGGGGSTAPAACCSCSRAAASRRSSVVAAAAAGASGAAAGSSGSNDTGPGAVLAAARAVLQAHFLPLALLTALLLGACCPHLGVGAANFSLAGCSLPQLVTAGIFVLQGLQLRRKDAAAALGATGAIAWGLSSILLVTPLLGLLVARLPLQPPGLALGLAVFCCMPTALSSGVTFTQQLGGNVSLALLLTVSSNILGIFTLPFSLPHVVAAAGPGLLAASALPATPGSLGGLEPLPLLLQLCKTILLPTVVGAAIRGFVPGAAGAIDGRRKLLSYASAALLALVPWMQISKAASQNIAVAPLALAATAAAGVAIHVAFLALNRLACDLLRLGGRDPVAARDVRRAVLLVASVKTLPVAVTVLASLAPVLGEGVVGVAVLPCVLAHLAQIIFDSLMVSRIAARDAAAAAAAAAARPGDKQA